MYLFTESKYSVSIIEKILRFSKFFSVNKKMLQLNKFIMSIKFLNQS